MMRARALLFVFIMGWVCVCASQAHASSVIVETVVVKINPDGSLVVRVVYNNYSSVPTARMQLTLKEGMTIPDMIKEIAEPTGKPSKHGPPKRFSSEDMPEHAREGLPKGTFILRRLSGKDYADLGDNEGRPMTYWIDGIPVTFEQFKAVVKPGCRLSWHANNGHNFHHIAVRGSDSWRGFLASPKDAIKDELKLTRTQLGPQNDLDRSRGVSKKFFPNYTRTIKIHDNALVKRNGKLQPYTLNSIKHNDWVVVQAPRLKQRVELLPPNHGDWAKLVNGINHPNPRKHGLRTHVGSFFGIMLSDQLMSGEADHANRGRPDMSVKVEPKLRKSNDIYEAILINGGFESPGKVKRSHYKKGGHSLIDGMFTSETGWDPRKSKSAWKSLVSPGRYFTALCRRGRITPDIYFISSDVPVAQGVITEIKQDGVTIQIAKNEVTGRPAHQVKIDNDAEFFHLGQSISKSSVLKVGNLISVYSARPQTILINDGKDHLISK